MENVLPKGWEVVKSDLITDITDYVANGSFQSLSENVKTYDNEEYAILLRLKDFNNNFKNALKYVDEKSYKFLSKSEINEGDLFISNVGNPGICYLVPNLGKPVTLGPNGIRLRVNKYGNTLFIKYYLQSSQGKKEINAITTGTAQLKFNKTDFRNLIFPLPPLAEQERIVAKLDALFAQHAAMKKALERIPQLLKNFRQQVLTQAVTGKLTKEFKYINIVKEIQTDRQLWFDTETIFSQKTKTKKPQKIIVKSTNDKSYLIDKLSKKIDITFFEEISAKFNNALKAGPFGSSLKKEYYVESGYKVYGQEQVINDNPFYGNYYINEEKYIELKSCSVKKNDILVSLVGTIGKVLIIPEKHEKGIINPRLVKLSLHDLVNPKYIKIYLQSEIAKGFFKENSHGGTMDVLNLSIIKSLPIPLPSTVEQLEIVSRVELLFTKADAIEARYKNLKAKIESLPQALLHKAFKGELVQQLPTDGDAKDLLAEILALKKDVKGKKKS